MSYRIIFLTVLILGLLPALSRAAPGECPTALLLRLGTQDQPPTIQIVKPENTITSAETRTGTVLRVNDDAITSTEVLAPLREDMRLWAAEMTQEQFFLNAQKAIYDSTRISIRDLLLYQQAQRELQEDTNFEMFARSETDKRKDEIVAQYDGSLARAQAEYARLGTSLDDQLEKYRRDLSVYYFQEVHLKTSRQITRRQMMQYYRAHLEDIYYQSPKVQFQLIDIQAEKYLPADMILTATEHLRTEARALAAQAAQRALGKIQEGVDFAEVVKEYSHGFRKSFDGLWQPLDPSSLQDQYQPVIAALATIDVGQVTGVIEGQDRYFIAKLISREEAHITPFRQAQADIKQILDQKYEKKQLEELLLTRLQEATLGNMEQFINDVSLNVYEQLKANIKENR